jgi:hypothetical protein
MNKNKRVGYFESDAVESNPEPEDIEKIIKQKVFQSTIKRPANESGHLAS